MSAYKRKSLFWIHHFKHDGELLKAHRSKERVGLRDDVWVDGERYVVSNIKVRIFNEKARVVDCELEHRPVEVVVPSNDAIQLKTT